MAYPLIDDAEPARERRRPPSHPGALMAEILEDLAVAPAEAALRMGVLDVEFEDLLAGARRCSAEIALRFARLTGGEPSLFLHMQDERDLWLERDRLGAEIDAIAPVTAPAS